MYPAQDQAKLSAREIAPRANGSELVGVLQRAQKVAEMAQSVAAQSDNIDRLLGSRPEASGNPVPAPTADNLTASLLEALDRTERALAYAISQLSRLGAALA